MAAETRKTERNNMESGETRRVTASSRPAASKSCSSKKAAAGSTSQMLRDVVGTAIGTEALLDLVERLGLVDLVVGRVRSKIEETDLDEIFEEVTDYLRRNPEVLVVTLGAVTIASALVVWMNSRREWDQEFERRGTGKRQPPKAPRSRKKTS